MKDQPVPEDTTQAFYQQLEGMIKHWDHDRAADLESVIDALGNRGYNVYQMRFDYQKMKGLYEKFDPQV